MYTDTHKIRHVFSVLSKSNIYVLLLLCFIIVFILFFFFLRFLPERRKKTKYSNFAWEHRTAPPSMGQINNCFQQQKRFACHLTGREESEKKGDREYGRLRDIDE